MKETVFIRKITSKECLALFQKKQDLIEKRNSARHEVQEKRTALYNLSHDIEDLIKDIDKKLPKFLSNLK